MGKNDKKYQNLREKLNGYLNSQLMPNLLIELKKLTSELLK